MEKWNNRQAREDLGHLCIHQSRAGLCISLGDLLVNLENYSAIRTMET